MGYFLVGFLIGGFFGFLMMGILNAAKDEDCNVANIINNIIVIMGKTASGKTTIVKKLTSLYGYKQIVTYTTRPMRDKEVQDVTYHFISDEDFKQKIQDGFFAEWKKYKTPKGTWYYGTALDDLKKADDKTVIILTPDGYKDITNKLGVRPKSIYIHSDNSILKERLIVRGDNTKEAKRRLRHDNKDFRDILSITDKVIFNDNDKSIDDVTNEILRYLRKSNNEEIIC